MSSGFHRTVPAGRAVRAVSEARFGSVERAVQAERTAPILRRHQSRRHHFQRRSWPVRSVRFARPVPGRPSVRGSVPCPRSRWSPLTRRPRRNGRCVRNARIWQDGRCRRSPVRHGRQRRPHPRRSPRFRRASRLPRRRCRQERSLNRWRSVDGISRSDRKCPMPGAISTRLRRPGNTARNRRIPAARRARSCRCAIRPRVCAWS